MKKYEPVVIEIIRFENEDIVTTSRDTDGLIVEDPLHN